ncbi:glutamate 5-kinase [Zychaea mexicana]|uniref:glutamate 5-kinase n=1 Tax=Zychaea mexicana TaxID=64656 RepID=UPI0022FE1F2B|nr:glutamate 5-kinase [Zychaea mexicana]KAI9489394.1 glutamate 5-kinase [Zychaea mexicana]
MIYKNHQNSHRPTRSSLTIVIKVGTTTICDEQTHFPVLSNLSSLVEAVLKLKSLGHRVVLITSAAVGTGLRRLNMNARPTKMATLQAVAAVGQGRLIRLYDDLFGQFHQPVAQVLLTKNDLSDRAQYLNAVSCLEEILDIGVVPIVNENDTICPQEIRFGDNDTLSAITAGMLKADYLFLLTDVDCLYTDNPRTNPDAKNVSVCHDIQVLREQVSVASRGSSLGTGGMSTKLIAADLATAAGVRTVITHGAKPDNIMKIIQADDAGTLITPHELAVVTGDNLPARNLPLHTLFTAKDNPLYDRKWWIKHGLHTAGRIYIDGGAMKAVVSKKQRSSLFAAGVVAVENSFVANQAVVIIHRRENEDGQVEEVEVGKGLVNYSSPEIERIRGCHSQDITNIIGYMDAECVIHRDNLVRTLENV